MMPFASCQSTGRHSEFKCAFDMIHSLVADLSRTHDMMVNPSGRRADIHSMEVPSGCVDDSNLLSPMT